MKKDKVYCIGCKYCKENTTPAYPYMRCCYPDYTIYKDTPHERKKEYAAIVDINRENDCPSFYLKSKVVDYFYDNKYKISKDEIKSMELFYSKKFEKLSIKEVSNFLFKLKGKKK